MAERFDILHRLQDLEILPPPEVFANLRHALDPEMPLEATMPGDADRIVSGCIGRLGQLEIEPPPMLLASIEKRIYNNRHGRLFYVYRSIAACLLLASLSWLIYRMNHSGKQTAAPSELAQKAPAPAPAVIAADTTGQPTDSLAGLASAQPAGKQQAPDITSTGPLSPSSIARLKKAPPFSIDGRRLSLVDNDLLVTFASYHYTEIPAFLNNTSADKDLTVHVDQFTNIIVTKNMARMMKDMYQYKSGDKLTRKARKTRERLDNWKKKDEERFDQTPGSNPLDPIDLARFIFK